MDLSLLLDNLPYLLVGAFPDGPLGGAALSLVLAMASAVASALLGVALGVGMALARGRCASCCSRSSVFSARFRC
jgi:polar amino acid transport system permease protein